jgi:predicted nucleic-acid-binding Zn-ribbon protein
MCVSELHETSEVTKLYKIKGCPRCHYGDIYEDTDEYGAYEQCFQCGWVNYPNRHVTQAQAEAEKRQTASSSRGERRRVR